MAWCLHCAKYSDTHYDDTTSTVCCVECGKIVSQDVFTEEATFVKDSAGGAHLAGNRVKIASISESHIRTLNKGYDVINELISKYGIENVKHATNFYKIAVERGFTRGRRTNQVAAACLYVACREKEKPFLLIEFSSELRVSVYELGTVYLQLCKLLSLQDHDIVQKPIDPSLFMHRYTSELVKDSNSKKILNTALHLTVSMKRDWIQTGRKPSGICAAALYVSSLLHGYNVTKTDVVKAVHICEATLTKRLIEFENTEAGGLTIAEFTQNAIDFENEMKSCKLPGKSEVVCEHKSKADQSGHGLCKDCYLEFCGGLYGSEPPAFQRAEMERSSMEIVKSLSESTPQNTIDNENETPDNMTETNNKGSSTESECIPPNSGNPDIISDSGDAFESSKEPLADESDTLSDIDDSEVIGYLYDEEESRLKKIIWEHINREYVQEQAAKEAAAAAARKLYTGSSEEIREAQALAAAAAQVVANKKQKDKRKRELEAKNAKPAKTAAEAAGQHFKKKLSSKINYDVLNDLFGDEDPTGEKMESYVKTKLPLAKYDMVPKHSFSKDIRSCLTVNIPDHDSFFNAVEQDCIRLKKSQSYHFYENGIHVDEDNTRIDTDIVIFATGFKGEEKLKDIFESSTFRDFIASSPRVPLYRECIHPHIPQLAVVGFPECLFNITISEMQVKWVIALLEGSFKPPSVNEMQKDIASWDEYMKQSAEEYHYRSAIGAFEIWYLDQLCKDMGINRMRKKGLFANLFEPYGPMDYIKT